VRTYPRGWLGFAAPTRWGRSGDRRIWDDPEDGIPGGLGREGGERRVRGDVEIGPVTGTRSTQALRIGAAAFGDSSSIRTVSECRPRVSATCPPARALCSHPTGPDGETSQRCPSSSTRVTGIERGLPLRRPGTVSSTVARGARPRRSSKRIRAFATRRGWCETVTLGHSPGPPDTLPHRATGLNSRGD
jgi:hypothetical protein